MGKQANLGQAGASPAGRANISRKTQVESMDRGEFWTQPRVGSSLGPGVFGTLHVAVGARPTATPDPTPSPPALESLHAVERAGQAPVPESFGRLACV